MAVGGGDHVHAVALEQAVERKDVAHVVVDHQHLAVAQRLVAVVQLLDHALLGFGQLRDLAVQEQRGLVEQPLGALHALEHDALGAAAQLGLLIGRQLAAR